MNVEGRYLGRSPHELQHVLGQGKHHGLLPEAARAGGHRADRPRRQRRRRRSTRTRPARPIRTLLADGVRAIAVSLLWSFKQPGARAAAPRAGPRGRPGRVRRPVARGEPADPGVRAQRDDDHEHADRPRPARLPRRARGRACASAGLAGPLLVMQSNGGAVAAREAPATAISTVGSVLTGGVVGSVALGRAARPPQHHLHRRRRHDVPRRADRRRRTGARHHHDHQPPPDQRADAAGARHRLRRRRHRLARRRRQPAGRPAQRAGACPARPATTRAAPSRPTPTPTWCSASSPSGACSAAASRCRSSAPARPSGTRIAEPLGLTVEDAAAAIYAVQNAQTGDLLRKTVVEAGHDPRDFVLYAFGGAGPAHCAALRRRGRRRARSSCRSGPVASAFSAYGLASSDIVARRRAVRPGGRCRSTRSARSKNFADLEAAGARRRSTGRALQFASVELRPRDRHALHDAARRGGVAGAERPARRGRDRPGRGGASSSATPSCTARAPASARPASRPSPTGSAGTASCRSRPELPELRRRRRRRTPRPRGPAAGRSASTPRAGFVDTADLRLPRACARATSSPGPADRRGADHHRRRPAGTDRHGRPPRQPHPSSPVRSPAPMTMPIPGSERFSSRPVDPDELASRAAGVAAAAHRHPGADRRRSTR